MKNYISNLIIKIENNIPLDKIELEKLVEVKEANDRLNHKLKYRIKKKKYEG
jgi:hypothetical protein